MLYFYFDSISLDARSLTMCCPNLRHLKIKGCRGLSNRVISKIAQICHLESLNVTRIMEIKNVKRFGKYKDMKDITLCKITNSCPNLQYLKLGSSKLSDISMKEVAHSCINLCHL